MQTSLLGQVWLRRKPVLLNEYYPSFCFGFLTEDSKVLGAIFGEAVHFHLLTRRDDYTKSLLELEDKYLHPIQPHDEEFQALNTNWISERGIHFGWDADDENIIFAARIV